MSIHDAGGGIAVEEGAVERRDGGGAAAVGQGDAHHARRRETVLHPDEGGARAAGPSIPTSVVPAGSMTRVRLSAARSHRSNPVDQSATYTTRPSAEGARPWGERSQGSRRVTQVPVAARQRWSAPRRASLTSTSPSGRSAISPG